jgi:hypothetical protein
LTFSWKIELSTHVGFSRFTRKSDRVRLARLEAAEDLGDAAGRDAAGRDAKLL